MTKTTKTTKTAKATTLPRFFLRHVPSDKTHPFHVVDRVTKTVVEMHSHADGFLATDADGFLAR